jgi:hypothetical protein
MFVRYERGMIVEIIEVKKGKMYCSDGRKFDIEIVDCDVWWNGKCVGKIENWDIGFDDNRGLILFGF